MIYSIYVVRVKTTMNIIDKIKNFFSRLFSKKRSSESVVMEKKEEMHPLEIRMRELLREKDIIRSEIENLEKLYDSGSITALEHDKLMREKINKILEINRELAELRRQLAAEGIIV